MELCVKRIDISTGDSPVVLITRQAAITHDLHTSDRVLLSANGRQVICAVNTTHTGFGLRNDQIGMFLETANALGIADSCGVTILPVPKPESINYIQKKMLGKTLSKEELVIIVQDIVSARLTQVELAFFVAACSAHSLSFDETVNLTRAITDTGVKLDFGKIVIDKHCIGGVPGNRTSMITVPIMASLGYIVPKTSSRAITSPAGTADTMEIFAEVDLPVEKMKHVVKNVNGCLVWGGSINLAPADDRIIRVERPLALEIPGLMISSVLAKKSSVGSTHVLIDIPYGPGAKVLTIKHAKELKTQFERIGKMLKLKVLVLLTPGDQPIGFGVGPLLEAYDVLSVLRNEESAPADLREKSIMIAGKLLEFVGGARKGEGEQKARAELESGRALRKFEQIIDAQGRHDLPPLAKYTYDILAHADGTVLGIDNLAIAKIARLAGAPVSKNAGVLLYIKKNTRVDKGNKLFTIHAASEEKLANAVSYAMNSGAYTISTRK